MIEGWTWDETLFAGAAPYYERGRLPYPEGLPQAFAAALGLSGRGRLLDVGCGPGSVCLRLATLVAEVVGVDADDGMVAEARRLAARRDIENARFVCARAEELPPGLGRFQLVTFAASFHWMDQPKVARTVRNLLTQDGSLVHVSTFEQPRADGPMRYPAPPKQAIAALRTRYLGDAPRAGRSTRGAFPDNEDDVFRAAGFHGPRLVQVPDERVFERSIDDIVAGTLSMSSSAPHLFAGRLDAFVADLRDLLVQASPDGLFSVPAQHAELRIWDPAR